ANSDRGAGRWCRGCSSFSRTGFGEIAHPPVPLLQTRMGGRQFVVTGIEKIGKHTPKIEIDKARLGVQQVLAVSHHLFEWDQPHGQFRVDLLLLLKPLVEAAAPKLP